MISTSSRPILEHQGIANPGMSNHRCILIARSHTLLKDHISALALYERAQSYISKIPSSMGSLPETDIPVTKDDIESLLTTLEGELTRSHANVIVSQPSSIETEHLNKVF